MCDGDSWQPENRCLAGGASRPGTAEKLASPWPATSWVRIEGTGGVCLWDHDLGTGSQAGEGPSRSEDIQRGLPHTQHCGDLRISAPLKLMQRPSTTWRAGGRSWDAAERGDLELTLGPVTPSTALGPEASLWHPSFSCVHLEDRTGPQEGLKEMVSITHLLEVPTERGFSGFQLRPSPPSPRPAPRVRSVLLSASTVSLSAFGKARPRGQWLLLLPSDWRGT